MPTPPQVQQRGPRAGWPLRANHLLLNWLAFALCYPLANHLAARQDIRRSIVLPFDAAVPFWPWMIVPYATSGLLFTLVFFAVRDAEQLRVASRRLLLATVAGALIFACYPLRFALPRPAIDAPVAALYGVLDLVDQPYNQLPSLHVAYCVILWFALLPLVAGWARAALGGWLLLVAASTLFTWQHHVIDVAGGLLLGGTAVLLIRPGHTRRTTVSFYYTVAAGIALLAGWFALDSWIALWASASLLLVALAYHRRSEHFLRKRNGRHPLASWLLFWPYLAAYYATWLLVCLRGRAPFTAYGPGLWVGRRLSTAEARTLPAGCSVIDLCTELPETAMLRGAGYHHAPLLDMHAPRPSQVRAVLALVAEQRRQGHDIYLHCAMGYSRSRFIARLHSRRTT